MQFWPFVISCCHCKSQVLGFSHRCLSKSLCSEQMSITINSSRFAKGSCYHCLLEYHFKMLSLGLPHNYCDKTQLCWILQTWSVNLNSVRCFWRNVSLFIGCLMKWEESILRPTLIIRQPSPLNAYCFYSTHTGNYCLFLNSTSSISEIITVSQVSPCDSGEIIQKTFLSPLNDCLLSQVQMFCFSWNCELQFL